MELTVRLVLAVVLYQNIFPPDYGCPFHPISECPLTRSLCLSFRVPFRAVQGSPTFFSF